jgi:hypothetical protein
VEGFQTVDSTSAWSGIATFRPWVGTYIGQQGPTDPIDGLVSYVGAQLAAPGQAGNFRNSPYVYAPVWFAHGRIPTGFDRTVRPDEVTKVTTDVAAQAENRQAWITSRWDSPYLPDMAGDRWVFGLPVDLPASQTRYLMRDGVRWRTTLEEYIVDNGFPEVKTMLTSALRSYENKGSAVEWWNQAVFGPAFPDGLGPYATREGNLIRAQLPLYSDGDGHAGTSVTDSASTILYRDGVKVAETTTAGQLEAEVPAEAATYRLAVTAERPSVSEYATTLEMSWTFRSEQVAGEGSRCHCGRCDSVPSLVTATTVIKMRCSSCRCASKRSRVRQLASCNHQRSSSPAMTVAPGARRSLPSSTAEPGSPSRRFHTTPTTSRCEQRSPTRRGTQRNTPSSARTPRADQTLSPSPMEIITGPPWNRSTQLGTPRKQPQEYRRPNVGTQKFRWKQAIQAFTIYFEGRIPTP